MRIFTRKPKRKDEETEPQGATEPRPETNSQRVKAAFAAGNVVVAVAQVARDDLHPVIGSPWDAVFEWRALGRRLQLRAAFWPMRFRSPWLWAALSLPAFILGAMMFPGVSAAEWTVRLAIGLLLGPMGSYLVWVWLAYKAVYAHLEVFANRDRDRPDFATHRFDTVAPRLAFADRPSVFFGAQRSGMHNGDIRLRLPHSVHPYSITSLADLYDPAIEPGRSHCTENVATERATLKAVAKKRGTRQHEKTQLKGWRRLVRDNALGICGCVAMSSRS